MGKEIPTRPSFTGLTFLPAIKCLFDATVRLLGVCGRFLGGAFAYGLRLGLARGFLLVVLIVGAFRVVGRRFGWCDFGLGFRIVCLGQVSRCQRGADSASVRMPPQALRSTSAAASSGCSTSAAASAGTPGSYCLDFRLFDLWGYLGGSLSRSCLWWWRRGWLCGGSGHGRCGCRGRCLGSGL